MSGDIALYDRSGAADAELKELREENKRLARALQDANLRADRAREDADRALMALRRQLSPLYRALQGVFGELDAAGVEDAPTPSGPVMDHRTTEVWAAWKSRVGAAGQLIDAFLKMGGEMNTQQLAIATGLHRTTIPKHIYTLNKAGLINKNGGKFSLKDLK